MSTFNDSRVFPMSGRRQIHGEDLNRLTSGGWLTGDSIFHYLEYVCAQAGYVILSPALFGTPGKPVEEIIRSHREEISRIKPGTPFVKFFSSHSADAQLFYNIGAACPYLCKVCNCKQNNTHTIKTKHKCMLFVPTH